MLKEFTAVICFSYIAKSSAVHQYTYNTDSAQFSAN